MRRFPFDILLTLLLGLGLGLAYSWLFSPLRVVDADPIALRADFKDAYRSAIAASYAATGNLPRAQARLALLGDTNSTEALNSQAQRLIASGHLHGDIMTVTGQTLQEATANAKETPGQQVVYPVSHPIKETGGLVILRGNLAPDGAVGGRATQCVSGRDRGACRESDDCWPDHGGGGHVGGPVLPELLPRGGSGAKQCAEPSHLREWFCAADRPA